MGESQPSLESVHRIRHHLAHALIGLVSQETEARGAMGNRRFDELNGCLRLSRDALDDWLNRRPHNQ
jgi:hypothetical protein